MISTIRALSARTGALLLLLSPATSLFAQEQSETPIPYLEFGVAPMTVYSRPIGTLESIRGSVPCSNSYNSGSNVNFGFLLWGALLLHQDGSSGMIRSIRFSAGYDDISTGFVASPGETFDAYDDVTGSYTTVLTNQQVDYTLRYLRAALEAEIDFGMELLRMRVGPNIDIPLSGSSNEQESILSPSNATFLDRHQERTIPEGTGTVNDLKPRLGIAAEITYRLPFGTHLFFEPHIGLDYGLTKIQPSWSPLIVRGGIDFGYTLFHETPPPAPQPEPAIAVVTPPPPEAPKPAPFTANVEVNVTAAHLPIQFRRQIVARYVPVLPVLFFDKNSSQIPERYRTDIPRASFTETGIPPDAIGAHHEVLAVIGERLKANPKATVTLTGTTSSDEENRKALAEARAEQIADELVTWGVERRRIAIRANVDPAVPSNSDYPEGRAENRRVEFEFNDPALYNPIEMRAVEPITDPRSIDFTTSVSEPSKPVDRWDLTLGSTAATIDHIDGKGTPPAIITWNLTTEDREHVLSAGEVNYRLAIYDGVGRYINSVSRSLPVQVDTAVTVTSSASRPVNQAEFLLVTFEYDRAQLTRRGTEEMKSILARIGPASTVSIVGYTDALGDAAHNRTLAEARARQLASLLPTGTNVESRGADPSEAPYGSDMPEGRFLSRTVRVTVTNPK